MLVPVVPGSINFNYILRENIFVLILGLGPFKKNWLAFLYYLGFVVIIPNNFLKKLKPNKNKILKLKKKKKSDVALFAMS